MRETLNKAGGSVRLAGGTAIKQLSNIGKYNRLSDFFNSKSSDPFLIVYEASMPDASGKAAIVNRNHIAWATPE